MPKQTMIDIAEFKDRVKAGERPSAAVRLASSGTPEAKADTRVVSFVFSDDSVDRMGDTIDAGGWQLDQFLKNPVALFGHDSASVENVVGRACNVRVAGNRLVGDIEFAEAAVSANADTVFRLVKGGFLNAVSVGFIPLEWKPTKNGGISFTKQALLEISVVPVPANSNALVQARAAGIVVDRLSFFALPGVKTAARVREARELAAKARALIARIPDGPPPTREERLAQAANFRRVALAAGK